MTISEHYSELRMYVAPEPIQQANQQLDYAHPRTNLPGSLNADHLDLARSVARARIAGDPNLRLSADDPVARTCPCDRPARAMSCPTAAAASIAACCGPATPTYARALVDFYTAAAYQRPRFQQRMNLLRERLRFAARRSVLRQRRHHGAHRREPALAARRPR